MNEILAQKMIGKIVLVGVTIKNKNEEILKQEQLFGTVLRINEKEGLIIRCGITGEEKWLPPAPEEYEPAKAGDYKLRSTGHVVTNPDFIASFTRYPKESH